MKHFIYALSILAAVSLQAVANADPEHRAVQPFATDHHTVFPQYSHTRPSFRNDSFRNRVSSDHMQRIEFAHAREENTMRRSQAVNTHVNINMSTYGRTLHPIYDQRRALYQDRFNHFHQWEVTHPTVWRSWQAHHFYGGAYYGFHPVSNISVYYYNPLVHWFYIGTWDPAYYRAWYANDYEAYPNANHAFPYYGVYYPTENLKQLLFGVSAMPMAEQSHFRSGIVAFTEQLTQNLANLTHQHVVLSSGDITLTHYETLGFDRGIELEGAVNFQGRAYDFKGLVNLDVDHSAEAFVADENIDQTSPEQMAKLDHLNQSLANLQSTPGPAGVASTSLAQTYTADPNVKSEYQAPATAGSKPWYPSPTPAPTQASTISSSGTPSALENAAKSASKPDASQAASHTQESLPEAAATASTVSSGTSPTATRPANLPLPNPTATDASASGQAVADPQ